MKKVILSADGDSCVYEVPDAVADDLERYCLYFCTKWIRREPQTRKYRIHGAVCYDQNDFIDYLNQYVFPNETSRMIENLGWTNFGEDLPEAYRGTPYFNF